MNKTKNEPAKAQPPCAPAALGKGAIRYLVINITPALAGLLLTVISLVPGQVLAQTDQSGVLENLPALQNTNASTINSTLAGLDALNQKLDDAIAKSSAAVDALGQAINSAEANFTPASSNAVESAEMVAFQNASEGLRLFIANGPKAMQLHGQITAKGDRIAYLLSTRIAVRVQAAKQLAQARNVPVDLVEVELTPAEAATLHDWSIVSDEVRFTEAGNRLHVDQIQGIMAAVSSDRARLAQEGESLAHCVKRMQMLQRCVQRFAADLRDENEFRRDAQEFHQESQRFQDLSDRYRKFTEIGERSISSRTGSTDTMSQNLELGGPVQ